MVGDLDSTTTQPLSLSTARGRSRCAAPLVLRPAPLSPSEGERAGERVLREKLLVHKIRPQNGSVPRGAKPRTRGRVAPHFN